MGAPEVPSRGPRRVCRLDRGPPDKGAAISAAELIGDSLSEPFDVGGSRVSVSASVGVAVSGSGRIDVGEDPEGLLREAHVAMRIAKKKGKARYRVFDAGATTTTSRRSLAESEMRRAVKEGEFRVHY